MPYSTKSDLITTSRRQVSAIEAYVSRISITTILAVAALLRFLSIGLVRNYVQPNSWEFGQIAHNMISGHGYSMHDGIPSAHMPPLYSYLLSGLWKSFGESPTTYLGLELFQALLGVLLVLVIYRLAQIIASERVALIAAMMVAVWPSFIYLCNEVHSISIYILLGVTAVYYLVRYIEVSRSWRDVVGLGLSMGGLLLCRGEAIMLLFAYSLILVWRCGRQSIKQALVVCLIAGACLAPWTIRNYRVLGHFVLITTSGGFNLWVGHNPYATGNSDYDLDKLRPDQQLALKREVLGRDFEIDNSRLYTTFALDFIHSHPGGELRLAGRKLLYFVLFDPTHKKSVKVAYWAPSLLLTLLAIYGIWLRRRGLLRSDLPLTFSILFAVLLAIAVFSLPRYRIAIDPFLAIFAAHAIACISQNVVENRLPGRMLDSPSLTR